MGKINEILDGWGNLIKDQFNALDSDIKELSESRLEKCNQCDLRVGNLCSPLKFGINIETNEIKSGCGCNLSAKTLSEWSKCPLGKW